MNLNILQRTIALAAVALVAGVAVLALTGSAADETTTGPAQVPVAGGGGWYTALAGSRGAPRDAERTTCARILTARSLGVSHPVLPCGAKIYISYGGAQVLTEVIDTKLKQPGRQFELTEALAQQLGIEGTQQIRWRFATR
ncbi:MAG TPA: hypothetical protein VM049_01765 [Gaiellaceae bacterium]|nr:hypothetical protein [Gaiellaceae bacterium]